MKSVLQKCVCVLLACIISVGGITPFRVNASEVSQEQWEDYLYTLAAFGQRYHFGNFLSDHAHLPRPDAEYIIEAVDNLVASGGEEVRIYHDYEGMYGSSLWTGEEGFAEWEVYVTESGLYNISVLYFTYPGRNSDIQRAIFITENSRFLKPALQN